MTENWSFFDQNFSRNWPRFDWSLNYSCAHFGGDGQSALVNTNCMYNSKRSDFNLFSGAAAMIRPHGLSRRTSYRTYHKPAPIPVAAPLSPTVPADTDHMTQKQILHGNNSPSSPDDTTSSGLMSPCLSSSCVSPPPSVYSNGSHDCK